MSQDAPCFGGDDDRMIALPGERLKRGLFFSRLHDHNSSGTRFAGESGVERDDDFDTLNRREIGRERPSDRPPLTRQSARQRLTGEPSPRDPLMNQELHPLSPFRVIPVLDLRGGKAVHARGGDRRFYQGVSSCLCPGHDPVELAAAFRSKLGLDSLYIADLDAIEHDCPDLDTLSRLGSNVWVDAGPRRLNRIDELVEAGTSTIILATETLPSFEFLGEAIERFSHQRIVFGLDLRDGRPLGGGEPRGMVERAVLNGVRRILLLDIGRVGTSRGVGSLSLLASIRERFEPLEVTIGGGIGSMADVLDGRDSGASAVLVGSALHDGRIGAEDLRSLL